jgi:hypothetical protein
MDYLVKVIIFVPFMALVYYVIDYFLAILQPYIASVSIGAALCQFGVFTGLNIFFSILLPAFIAREVLDFVK